jgi:hypothetical protein
MVRTVQIEGKMPIASRVWVRYLRNATGLPGFTHKADGTGENVRPGDRGAGYGNSRTCFAPLLRDAGIDEDLLGTIQRDDPRAFLAFIGP